MRNRLEQYVDRKCSLDEFENWFDDALLAAANSSDEAAVNLGHQVEWAFFDLERGCPVETVLATLKRLAEPSAVIIGLPLIFGATYFGSLPSGSSSMLQHAAAPGSMGRPQILPETVRA
jgi:hypothetical protein